MVTNIQQGTRNNALLMDETASTIEKTTALAQTSGEALHKIVSMVEGTTTWVRRIGQAVELQIVRLPVWNRQLMTLTALQPPQQKA